LPYPQSLPVRAVGLLGRLPLKPVTERFALRYAHEYLKSPLPTPTYPIDVTEGITDWGMGGNATYGDCACAGEYHLEMSTAVAAGVAEPNPDSDVPVQRYVEFTGVSAPPGPGCNLADFLLWLYQRGDIKGFAPVDDSDLGQCDALMQAGIGLYCGVLLTADAQPDFANRAIWGGSTPIQPTPSLGHCILRVAATGAGPDDVSEYVTWGALQKATRAWDAACTEETWLVVTTEEQLAKFTPTLLADIEALHGTGAAVTPAPTPVTPSPVVTPTPAPVTPTPAPTPSPVTPFPFTPTPAWSPTPTPVPVTPSPAPTPVTPTPAPVTPPTTPTPAPAPTPLPPVPSPDEIIKDAEHVAEEIVEGAERVAEHIIEDAERSHGGYDHQASLAAGTAVDQQGRPKGVPFSD